MVGKTRESKVLVREISYWLLPVIFVFLPVSFAVNNIFGISRFIGISSIWLSLILLTCWLIKFGLFQNSTLKIFYSWFFAIIVTNFYLAAFLGVMAFVFKWQGETLTKAVSLLLKVIPFLGAILLYVCLRKRKQIRNKA